MNLYQITQEAQYLAALLETEELTPELEAELLINQEQLQSKGINYAKVIANYQSESDQIDAEIKRLKALKESRDYLEAETMLRHAAHLAPQEVNIHRQLGAVVALNLVHNRRMVSIE